MKIGINLLPLRPGKIGGMEIYFRNLLAKLATIDRENEYYLVTASYNDASLTVPGVNFKKIVFSDEQTVSQKIQNCVRTLSGKSSDPDSTLQKIIDRYHLDIWFCPFFSLDPRPVKIPSLVTIPDIQHEYYPENFSEKDLILRQGYTKSSGEMATAIITLSAFSKQCFIDKFGLDPVKIHVVHLSAGDAFFDGRGNVSAVTKKYTLPGEYFFYPANGWPHKNHQMLLIGYSFYRKSCDNPLHLVLSGIGLQGTIPNRIAQLGLQEYVHILDYIDREDLPGLYKNAKALVFPSLFEGFGIPLLEAMAMECPIIASDATSIPEVAGDAAYYFDPVNPQSICDAMHRIADDPALRENLVRKGKNRVVSYSYDTVARRHLALFASALSQAEEVGRAYRNRNKVDSSRKQSLHFFPKRV